MAAAIEISNISKSYGNVEVLINASLVVEDGTTLGLIGLSGAGKSNLLRCINHLGTIDSGAIKVNGEMVGYRREGNRLFELGHSELSGGQQQRVGIARAHAMDRKVMLLDEPTSALDPALVGEVLDTMTKLSRRGITMLVVTHEIEFARDSCDNVAIMVDGGIIEHGPPGDVLVNPQEARSQAFLRRVIG
jgi:polar amino acid transport system ATP-binding protein